MKSLIEILKASTEYLAKKGIEHPKRQAEDLLCDIFGLSRLELYMQHDRPLNEQELTQCREKLLRRSQGEPLAYIHGKVEFYNCSIVVSPAVLIPRQETEILIDLIDKKLSQIDVKGKRCLDLCCGSGCIGIALKKRYPELNVTLSDVSKEALTIARKNSQINEVDVRILQGDLFEPLKDEKFDFLICNPPYISEEEYLKLDREVRDFEPKVALVGGQSGLEFYERLANGLSSVLLPGGMVWLEIGHQQGAAIKKIFEKLKYKEISVKKDWADHDRFFFLENE